MGVGHTEIRKSPEVGHGGQRAQPLEITVSLGTGPSQGSSFSENSGVKK